MGHPGALLKVNALPPPPPPKDRTSLLLWCPQQHHVPVVVFSISCDQQISFKSEFLTLDCYLLLLLLLLLVLVLLLLSLSLFYYFIFFNRHPNLNAIQYIFVNMAISEVTDQDASNGFQ